MQPTQNNLKQVITATMIGTTIEYFDNYIYAIAAVLIFNHQFFYADPVSSQIAALSTLALTFIARPLGAALFGHFGDRFGRKNTLVVSLLLMGSATVIIGLLPTYEHIGIWATLLLCLCRIGQGIGLGGEWGGAALVAIENAPQHKRGWYGTFPQLGAPIGLLLANGVFFVVNWLFGDQALVEWAWRIPFISSVILIFIGLYVRLKLVESPIFITAIAQQKRAVNLPIKWVFSTYAKPFILGMLLSVAGYVLFYIMIAFAQVYAKSPVGLSPAGYATGLGLSSGTLTFLLMCSAFALALTISLSGYYIDRIGRKQWMIITTLGVTLFGLFIPFFLENATTLRLFFFFMIGMGLIGMGYGPLASLLPELFPTEVRYSGASLAYNCAGILGASVATLITIPLNNHFGLWGVGIYLFVNGLLSLGALWKIAETKDSLL